MSKEKRQTLNADKRKVIADVFQDHFESKSKYKTQHTSAIQTYNDMRSIAKTKIEQLVRFHQPQEDVDTIRAMINKYGERMVASCTMIIVSMFKMQHLVWIPIIIAIQKKY